MEEIWKDIEGYDGKYQISNLGRVFSKHHKENKFLSFRYTYNGYRCVELFKMNKRKSYRVHRLVATHFIGKINEELVVNHIDGDRINNKLDNLEIISVRENVTHSYLNRKKTSKYVGVEQLIYPKSGKKAWRSRITVNKKRIAIGVFATEEQAYFAIKKYEKDNNIINKYR